MSKEIAVQDPTSLEGSVAYYKLQASHRIDLHNAVSELLEKIPSDSLRYVREEYQKVREVMARSAVRAPAELVPNLSRNGVIGGFLNVGDGYQTDPCPECSAAALEKLSCLGNGTIPGNSVGNTMAQEALEMAKNPPYLVGTPERESSTPTREQIIHELRDEFLSLAPDQDSGRPWDANDYAIEAVRFLWKYCSRWSEQ